jgi:hypothetical protein
MTGWGADELEKIETADELEIASLRSDGTLGSQRKVWVGQPRTLTRHLPL